MSIFAAAFPEVNNSKWGNKTRIQFLPWLVWILNILYNFYNSILLIVYDLCKSNALYHFNVTTPIALQQDNKNTYVWISYISFTIEHANGQEVVLNLQEKERRAAKRISRHCANGKTVNGISSGKVSDSHTAILETLNRVSDFRWKIERNRRVPLSTLRNHRNDNKLYSLGTRNVPRGFFSCSI